MTRTALVVAIALLTGFASAADAKRAKTSRHAAKAIPVQPRGFHQEPARMIEVKPGLWISSWGCVTDEGYGRYSSCDIPDGK
jgi:hypothetical protein